MLLIQAHFLQLLKGQRNCQQLPEFEVEKWNCLYYLNGKSKECTTIKPRDTSLIVLLLHFLTAGLQQVQMKMYNQVNI